MKTDVIAISPAGEGMVEALRQTEKAAAYQGLTPKESLRLRLLGEEMMGMLRTIVGEGRSSFWVEAEGKDFSLHLAAGARINTDMREELLKTATSGKNAAVKGFMSRLRDIFTQLVEPDSATISPADYGFSYVDVASFDASLGVTTHGMLYGWSMKEYKNAVEEHREEEADKWDELEKSITARLADEVKIFIRGNTVEMVIEKTF
ncbi:MAG: hypothetical protein IJI97_08185 [Clostridia bacterium]|nr:hypothetical protein [Clostridia bacterium]